MSWSKESNIKYLEGFGILLLGVKEKDSHYSNHPSLLMPRCDTILDVLDNLSLVA